MPPVIENILAHRDYRARRRALRAHRRDFSPGLAQELLRQSHARMRQDPAEAAQLSRLAFAVSMAVADEETAVASLRARAEASLQRGRFAAALRELDRVAARAPGATLEAGVEVLRVHALIHLERYDEARTTAAGLLATYEANGDRTGQVRTHMTLADLAFRLDRPGEALRHYARVEALLPAGAPARVRAVLASNRANSLAARNRFHAAARHFEAARATFDGEDCAHGVAQVDYNLAYAEALCGRYGDALRRLARAEEGFASHEDGRHLAHVDLDRAEIHVHLNLPAEALRLARRAAQRFAALGLEKERAQALHLAGRAAELAGDDAEAERLYARAERRLGNLGLVERRLSCLLQRACLRERTGRAEQARELATRAAELLDAEANPLSRASVELLAARLDLRDRDAAGALERAERVRIACRRIHAPWVKIELHRTIGRARLACGQIDEAILAYKHAVDELERCRGGVPADEYMSAFLAGRSELYTEIVDLCARAGHAELAFEYTERSKSRALADLMARRMGCVTEEAPSGLRRRIRAVRERLNAIYARLLGGGEGERSARALDIAQKRAARLEHRLARMLREARLREPRTAALEAVDSPALRDVQENLGPDTALLEYVLSEDWLLIFVVTADAIRIVRQDVREEKVRHHLRRFRFHLTRFEQLQRPGAEELALRATRANLEELREILIDPVREHLDVQRLVIVPQGILHHVPFHALPDGEGWIADRHEVVYAPSAAIYGMCGRESVATGPACVLGLADAAAPEIDREVREVGRELGTDRVFVGEEATLACLRDHGPDARFLHLATHGMFRPEQPMLSTIRLADTWLNLYDLYELRLGAELVVLSTCESGTADVTDGDDIVGLTRGFLHAGAAALLASQWRVHDVVTREFMASLYEHLQAGRDAAGAHRAAMASVRARHAHPYYWAGFFLTGRPRAAHHTNRSRERGTAPALAHV